MQRPHKIRKNRIAETQDWEMKSTNFPEDEAVYCTTSNSLAPSCASRRLKYSSRLSPFLNEITLPCDSCFFTCASFFTGGTVLLFLISFLFVTLKTLIFFPDES